MTYSHTVVGDLRVLEGVSSPQLGNRRDILVHLPFSYRQGHQRYPVLYMHDGQNLFDEATSFCGEWQVDETMEELRHEGLEAIVVGIPNMGDQRCEEYSPFPNRRFRSVRGAAYLAFLVETVKPLIDHTFRTLPEREHTGIMGSSMGGLISLYAFFRHPEVFGFAGVMSPSLWFARQSIFDYVRRSPFVPGRVYLDMGTGEGATMLEDARRMHHLLAQKGYHPGQDLLYLEDHGGIHHESAWGARFPAALEFLVQHRTAAPDPAPENPHQGAEAMTLSPASSEYVL